MVVVSRRAVLALPFAAAIVVYMVINRVLVSVAVAWSSERPYLRVLQEDWFYRAQLLHDLALFLLSLVVVICYDAISYVGLVLFYSPVRIIYESQKRYAELRRAQNMLIYSERMAAKGEMAAEIGHELRNQLVAISARAQMLVRDSERQQFANVGRHAQIILEQSHRMELMSKGGENWVWRKIVPRMSSSIWLIRKARSLGSLVWSSMKRLNTISPAVEATSAVNIGYPE